MALTFHPCDVAFCVLFDTFRVNLNFDTIYYYKVVLFSEIFVGLPVLLNDTSITSSSAEIIAQSDRLFGASKA